MLGLQDRLPFPAILIRGKMMREPSGTCPAVRARSQSGRLGVACLAVSLLLLGAIAFAHPAIAQTVPTQAEPRQPEEQPQPPGQTPSALSVPQLQLPGQAPPGADQMRFTLSGIAVDGATVYSPEFLQAFYRDKMGQEASLNDIYDIAAAIETKYRDDGYFLSRVFVPVQQIKDGQVRLQVIEGYVSEVKVSGDVGPVRELIESYVNKIPESRPARLVDVERYLLLANDVPGITAQGVLQGGAAADGATKMVVNVERDWFSGYAKVDNRDSHFVGPWRIIAAPGFNSFTRFGERVQATGALAIDEFERGFAGLSAEARVGSEGLKIGGTFSYELTEPGRFPNVLIPGRSFDVETDTLRFGFNASYPVIRSRATNLWVKGGFDFANIDLDTDAFGPQVRDDMRVLWAGIQVDHRDDWGGANLLQVRLRQGLGILGNTDGKDALPSRADADENFTSLQFSAARRQSITDELDLYLAGKAQFSFEPLLADEECSVGGETFGRGYDPGEIADDQCLAGTVELQYHPEWRPAFLKDYVQAYQLYGFYDVGRVWPENGDFGDGNALQSAGIGLRTQFTDWFRIDLEVAKPLTRERSGDSDDRRMPRFYLGTVAQF